MAILCNHQKTVAKSFEITKQKLSLKIDIYKLYLDELKSHLLSKKMSEYEEEIDLEPPNEAELDKMKKIVEGDKKKKKLIFIKKFPGT